MARTTLAVAALALAAGSQGLSAQQLSQPLIPADPVDRVVAVVGDSVILASEVEQQVVQLLADGQLPTDDPEVLAEARRQILDDLVTDLLLVQAALRDSLSVTQQEVDAAVESQMENLRRTVGSDAVIEQLIRDEMGMSLQEYRDFIAREFRKQSLSRQYLQSAMRDRRPPPVTNAEIREVFEQRRSQLGPRPASISFSQIVVTPQPTDSAKAVARARAEEILAMARNGEDFAELARRFSQDPGSRELGGDLGWHREGSGLVEEFERAMFSLPTGVVSGIVETSFGFHIIKVERIRGAERQARHILIQPEITPEDVARTQGRAEEAAARIRAGEPFDSIVAQYHRKEEQTHVNNAAVDRLPGPYATALAGARPGDIIGPFPLGSGAGQVAYAVVRVNNVTEAGDYTLEDLQSQIRQQLEQQKLIDEILDELRRRTYVDIRL